MQNKVSVVIPVRIDTNDRLENINTSVRYLQKYFPEFECIIIEDDESPNVVGFDQLHGNLSYVFVKNKGRFSRARTFNTGLLKSSAEYVFLWDCDCIVDPEAIKKSLLWAEKYEKAVVLPHNMLFVDVKNDTRRKIIEDLEVSDFPICHSVKQAPKLKQVNTDIEDVLAIPSGIVMFNRRILLAAGGLNKSMVSYGWEDVEVLKRLEKLGYFRFIYGKYNLVHLHHARGKDSKVGEYYDKNKDILDRVLKMSSLELKAYINEEINIVEKAGEKEAKLPKRSLFKRQIDMVRYNVNRTINFLTIRL